MDRGRGQHERADPALTALIKKAQPFVAELSCAALATIVPNFRPNLYDFVGKRLGTAALLLDEASGNLLTTFTCTQMGSTLCDPKTVHRSANMYVHFFHEFMRAFMVLAGGPTDALAPFDGVSNSELAALLQAPGDGAFNSVLQREGLLQPPDRYFHHSDPQLQPTGVSESTADKRADKAAPFLALQSQGVPAVLAALKPALTDGSVSQSFARDNIIRCLRLDDQDVPALEAFELWAKTQKLNTIHPVVRSIITRAMEDSKKKAKQMRQE